MRLLSYAAPGVFAVLRRPCNGCTGRGARFFYVLHIHLLALATWLFGLHAAQGGIVVTLVGSALTVLVLSSPVARYQRYKAAHPNALTRYP